MNVFFLFVTPVLAFTSAVLIWDRVRDPSPKFDTVKMINGLLLDALQHDVPQDYESVKRHVLTKYLDMSNRYGLPGDMGEIITMCVLDRWQPEIKQAEIKDIFE